MHKGINNCLNKQNVSSGLKNTHLVKLTSGCQKDINRFMFSLYILVNRTHKLKISDTGANVCQTFKLRV